MEHLNYEIHPCALSWSSSTIDIPTVHSSFEEHAFTFTGASLQLFDSVSLQSCISFVIIV